MKKKKRFFDFDTDNLAVPEYHPRRRLPEESEEGQERHSDEAHHLHIRTDYLAVPEVVLEEEAEDKEKGKRHNS